MILTMRGTLQVVYKHYPTPEKTRACKRIIKYEKTINLLKKFAEVLNQKKKSKKKTEKLPSNIIKIADFLKNRKIA